MKGTLILHLGGSMLRGTRVLELKQQYPDADILVSSEGGDPVLWYEKRGATAVHDTEAWDTVTNFTYTFDRIKSEYDPKRIIVVTHDWHMPRSRAIAEAVYLFRGVELVYEPYLDGSQRDSDRNYLPLDFLRALLWRFTGLLLFHGNVYDQRCKDRPVRWNEIRMG